MKSSDPTASCGSEGYSLTGPCALSWPAILRLTGPRVLSWPATLRQRSHGCPLVPPRAFCVAQPLALPGSLFAPEALADSAVQWQRYQCKSFECVARETQGMGPSLSGALRAGQGPRPRCQRCFNLTAEAKRWASKARGAIPLDAALALKNGSIR